MGTIMEARGELIPGEAVDELSLAWEASEGVVRQLAVNLAPADATFPVAPVPPPETIPYTTLVGADLTGPVGKAKRSFLQRLKDRFFRFWHLLPRTDEARARAGEAAVEYLELGETVVSSIPGYEKAVELISLFRQLTGQKVKRPK
jgi:hypothetical protein